MNHAVILAGGVGSRMHMKIPKQYYDIKGKPIFMYSYEKFANHPKISTIVLVVAKEWEDFVTGWISKKPTDKKVIFTQPGKSREHSILSGLRSLCRIAEKNDIVIIHDGVRPLFPISNIDDGIESCTTHHGGLPVISVKDAIIQSSEGKVLSSYLQKDELYCGQTPESYRYWEFYSAHMHYADAELELMRSSVDLASRESMDIKLLSGSEENIKVTTYTDIFIVQQILENQVSDSC